MFLKSFLLLAPSLCRSVSPRCVYQGVLGKINFAWSLAVHFHGFVTLGWQEQTVQRGGGSRRSASLFLFCPLTGCAAGEQAEPVQPLQVCMTLSKRLHPLLLQPSPAYVSHFLGAAVDFQGGQVFPTEVPRRSWCWRIRLGPNHLGFVTFPACLNSCLLPLPPCNQDLVTGCADLG